MPDTCSDYSVTGRETAPSSLISCPSGIIYAIPQALPYLSSGTISPRPSSNCTPIFSLRPLPRHRLLIDLHKIQQPRQRARTHTHEWRGLPSEAAKLRAPKVGRVVVVPPVIPHFMSLALAFSHLDAVNGQLLHLSEDVLDLHVQLAVGVVVADVFGKVPGARCQL